MAARHITDFVQYLRSLGAVRQAAGLGDDALVERFVRENDSAAFEALLGRHGPMIWTVVRRLLTDPHEAEDAFQATWLVFVRRARTMRQPRQVANWLYGVAHKVAARSRAQTLRRQARQHGDSSVSAIAAPDPAATETVRILHEELNALPLAYRAPLVLCYLEGHRKEEAAAMLGWSPGTIHGRLERGRHRLRSRLERRGIGLTIAGLGAILDPEAGAAVLPAALTRTTSAAVVAFLTDPRSAHEALRASAVILTDGVCRTMQLAKFKVIVLWVLAASLIGGAGVLAGRGDGPAAPANQPPNGKKPAVATKPPVANPPPPPVVVPYWPQANAWQADWVHDQQEAAVLEKQLEEQEVRGSELTRKARRALLLAQEKLRQVEQRELEQRRMDQAAMQEAEQRVLTARQHLEKAKEISRSKPKGTLERAAQDELDRANQKLEELRELAEARNEATSKSAGIDAKLSVMAAQDDLNQIEQRLDREHRNLLEDLQLIQRRIREARWGMPPTFPAPQAQLEQKVDQLAHQIEALRRELQHQSGTALPNSR